MEPIKGHYRISLPARNDSLGYLIGTGCLERSVWQSVQELASAT